MNFTYYDDKKQPNEQGRQDVSEEVLARIENNFTYHPPFGSQWRNSALRAGNYRWH